MPMCFLLQKTVYLLKQKKKLENLETMEKWEIEHFGKLRI